MRRLDPEPAAALDDEALAAAYPWPDGPGPHLRAVMITALDGATSLAGRSGSLGSPADARLFAVLRDLCDVILVGAGTVRAEHYAGAELTARRTRWGFAAPPVIAVVSTGSLTGGEAVFTQTKVSPLVITTSAGRRALPRLPAELIVAGETTLDLRGAIAALHERGLDRISCEGGPHLLGALIAEDLVDELALTVAPLMAGPTPGLLGGAALPGPRSFTLAGVCRDGDHLFTRYRRDRAR